MNIEEAIKYFEDKRKDYIVSPSVIHVSTVEVINILKQIKLDKPKPEIPQFVADWIEKHKADYITWEKTDKADFVFRCINDLFNFGADMHTYDFDVSYEISKWTQEHAYGFIVAVLFGYTVKKEKLYIVEIPNPNSGIEHKHIALARLANGKLGFSEIIDTDFYSREDVRLTESEIRKDFDWVWREEFPKEVTE
ncbi:phage protein [Streptococcus equi subsp. equi]|uniref:DUF1642 domain-containing protein n=1 Tax=Streptococcus equi TaxID=1336 RepID=UPI000659EA69|nr:DUF1642 domain-containing protein [Streptococcus equi]UFR16889.1 DUF1642 domain-containing protein [Streptococcus equi subsp. zooepidemicus]CRQ91052.1 phage protein [Streptococcus equi subsp. equi]CRR07415.1 phage protein [Streptococcus equi subsp. equi]CRR16665.1 phage protein [Streptococcus equi subsp. equi]CRR20989.1 phage protein [Streptococcus equi subsp. equi]